MQLRTSMHLHLLSCLPDTPTLALHLERAYSPFGLELTSAPHVTPSPTPKSAAPSVFPFCFVNIHSFLSFPSLSLEPLPVRCSRHGARP